jgi:perosamine synthetase
MNALNVIPLFKSFHSDDMERVALAVMRSGYIASGPEINHFEREFSAYIGASNIVTLSDMTHALQLALRLSGVSSGDDVAAISFACLKTNMAISLQGANPIWIDIDPLTMSMCPKDLERKITATTKAVILYHVAGYPAAVRKIADICRSHGVSLIEDCNNALGAFADGKHVGLNGKFSVFSFYPNRQINGFEGAALVCPNEKTALHAKRLRSLGIDTRTFRDKNSEINASSDIPETGISAAFNQLNASVAKIQLSSLAMREKQVRRNALFLSYALRKFEQVNVVMPNRNTLPAYWCFLLLTEKRDKVLCSLKALGIGCSKLHYRNDNYTVFQSNSSYLPGTQQVTNQLLAIPCGWWLNSQDLQFIVDSIESSI